MRPGRLVILSALSVLVAGATTWAWQTDFVRWIGKQKDGRTLVSSGQLVQPESFSFQGRPADMALHPGGKVFAMSVMSQVNDFVKSQIVLADEKGVIEGAGAKMSHHPGIHGLTWSPDGKTLVCSTGEKYADQGNEGVLEVFRYQDGKLTHDRDVVLNEGKEPAYPYPTGLTYSSDGSRLYVCCVELDAVLELDAKSFKRLRKLPVSKLPYTAKLTSDGQTLVVSNWGGHIPREGELTSITGNTKIAVDKAGAAATGTVSFVNLRTGATKEVEVGMHPTDILVDGDKAYVANSMSDSVSTLDLKTKSVVRTDRLEWRGQKLMGSMPTALAQKGQTLYVCDGGDNAVAEFDLVSHRVRGYRPAGYYPVAIAFMDGKAVVANSKGNGSIARTKLGKPGNAHEFEGTVSVLDLSKDLVRETQVVARNNEWDKKIWPSHLPVYNGAIQHVLYIIKENKTYDQIYGDMPEGNGDPKLCILGETIMPNHRALAREFTLYDNAYVSGTNSGDGHQWSTQALADDYVERGYVNYRTYNDDGNCAMSLSNYGTIWDAAAAKGLGVRVYGEFVVANDAEFKPRAPKDWFEAWEDRRTGKHQFTYVPHARVEGIKPFVHPTVHYWPLIQSDQHRADEFIKDLRDRIDSNTVPNLMIMSLPCDHTEGEDPAYPAPKSMMADNDLALGRVVDFISHSAIWKNTAIFVIEDDSQSGVDHVDGHRTPYLVISPYTKRHHVDHNFYTTVSMISSMERMLGFGPMNRFDALADPITASFNVTPDLTPYDVRPNNIPLDLPNPGRKPTAMSATDRLWMNKTLAMDWSAPDRPDAETLDRIIWHSLKGDAPYPMANKTAFQGETDDK